MSDKNADLYKKKNDGKMSKLLRDKTSINFRCYYFHLLFLNPSWVFSACFLFSVHENFICWLLLLNFLRAGLHSKPVKLHECLPIFDGFVRI